MVEVEPHHSEAAEYGEGPVTTLGKPEESTTGQVAQMGVNGHPKTKGKFKARTWAQILKGTHPLHAYGLQSTRDRDWTGPEDPALTPEQQELVDAAQATTAVHDDDHLWELTPLEDRAFRPYLRGEIELRHPPGFLKATLSVMQRAIIEDFHSHYVDYYLTADIPAGVKWGRRPAHMTILEDLLKANTGANHGLPMKTRLVKDVKRFSYDGRHTLTVVFYPACLAHFWAGTTLRVLMSTTTLLDTNRNPMLPATGTYSTAQLKQQYAVRVLGVSSLSLVDITLAMADIAQCGVLDVEAPRTEALDIVHNGYFLIRFAQMECPLGLQNVTHIDLNGTAVLVHHFQTNMRIPCYKCFSARHNAGRRKVPVANLDAARKRLQGRYTGTISHYETTPIMEYNHPDATSLQSFLKELQFRAEKLVTPSTGPSPPYTTMEAVEYEEAGLDDFMLPAGWVADPAS
ncbi:hypothetical protein PC129_g21844 [Phytophthora cactorum]|uniref:Uncharacterized protein n=1 Tax=Phytophthora cactorum TaxID=29920 RepID=A0A329S7E2_9STRA|nr:hypothetical protein Pcac1_g24397 [Phytophthora cactorum]KAG2795711.1 hypothetical protein PC111_g22036 [Phytophthora cactorum]KAG2828382.1 hypothetical protein PC112_g8493 [Phytophthora cactorum]KAG2854845.1 hypothetical protein PC113_g12964 [Phytophthora cactorum]KAG2911441.1 hypothetical protein PC114_g9364 [Phytophthora cactorum]